MLPAAFTRQSISWLKATCVAASCRFSFGEVAADRLDQGALVLRLPLAGLDVAGVPPMTPPATAPIAAPARMSLPRRPVAAASRPPAMAPVPAPIAAPRRMSSP